MRAILKVRSHNTALSAVIYNPHFWVFLYENPNVYSGHTIRNKSDCLFSAMRLLMLYCGLMIRQAVLVLLAMYLN